jgi:hypothetical protein
MASLPEVLLARRYVCTLRPCRGRLGRPVIFWISPFPEEDDIVLDHPIGADHVLMGSGWPHPEGNVDFH